MIGNDIVDLAQSRLQSKWSRKGLIEKLFTTEEQYFIKNTIIQKLWYGYFGP